MSNRAWSVVDIVALCLMPLSFVGAWKWDWFQERAATQPVRILALQIGLLLLFSIALGKSKDRTAFGVLIDEACRISLGRLQAFLWTLIIVGGIAAALTVNLARECTAPPDGTEAVAGTCAQSPFSIEVPTDILALAGITAATFTVSSFLTNQGLTREMSPLRRNQLALNNTPLSSGYVERGVMAARVDPTKASLGDLVRGQFVSDNSALDLSRIQFLALTVILAGGYLVSFAQGMSTDALQPVGSFPTVDSGLNALLGISAGVFASLKAFKEESLTA